MSSCLCPAFKNWVIARKRNESRETFPERKEVEVL
jgi:hypothetical protein